MNMDKWKEYKFESSTSGTQKFSAFARDLKKYVKANLPEGATLEKWNVGHYCASGFVKKLDKYAYIAIRDVRNSPDSWCNNILVRTAKDSRDYAGGSNNYMSLANLTEAVGRTL